MHILGSLWLLRLKAYNKTTRVLPSSQQIFKVEIFRKYTKSLPKTFSFTDSIKNKLNL